MFIFYYCNRCCYDYPIEKDFIQIKLSLFYAVIGLVNLSSFSEWYLIVLMNYNICYHVLSSCMLSIKFATVFHLKNSYYQTPSNKLTHI